MPRLVLISDTHGLHDGFASRHGGLPDGDVLVHAGDFTKRGRLDEVRAFADWVAGTGFAHTIVVAGNHDFLFQKQPELARELLEAVPGLVYLEHETAEVAGLRIFGSPWQPWFCDWAFNLPRGEQLARRWRQVPSDLDLFVTHSPPFGVLDLCDHGERVGCEALRDELPRIAPKLHAFGHIHEARGVVERDGRVSVNACSCNLAYELVHAPIVVDVDATRVAIATSEAGGR